MQALPVPHATGCVLTAKEPLGSCQLEIVCLQTPPPKPRRNGFAANSVAACPLPAPASVLLRFHVLSRGFRCCHLSHPHHNPSHEFSCCAQGADKGHFLLCQPGCFWYHKKRTAANPAVWWSVSPSPISVGHGGELPSAVCISRSW